MLFNPADTNAFDRLAEEVRCAPAPTRKLIGALVASACTRLPQIARASKARRIDALIEASAWADTALALVEIELPAWMLRSLVHEDGAWRCSLSQNPGLPAEFDDTADGTHENAALAIWTAFLEARRRSATRDARRARAGGAARPGCVGLPGLLRQFRLKARASMIRREGPVLIAVEPYKRSPRRVRRARAKSLIANLAVATLGILVLLCAALLSPILWTALSESTHPKAPLCGTIKNPLAPSACPDTLKGGLGDPEHAAPRGAVK